MQIYSNKTFLVLFVLTVSILGAGCSLSGKSKEELLKEGNRLMEARNYRGSIVYYKNALEKDPNFFEARLQLGRAYYQTGQFDSAERDLQKVVRQVPSSHEAHKELARVYAHKHKTEDALKEIADLIAEGSSDAEALEIAGQAYAGAKEYVLAERFLKRAMGADTEGRSAAGFSLARLYYIQQKVPQAKNQIEDLLKKKPADSKALNLLADIQIAENDNDAAMKTFDLIIGSDPADAEAKFRKGAILLGQKKYDLAHSLADQLIDKQPKRPEGYRLKGMVLVLTGKVDDAVAVLQKSLTLGQNVSSYYFLGLANLARKEPEQAISQFNKALDMNPKYHPARMLLATTLMHQKRTDDAITEIRKVTEAEPSNAHAHSVLASALVQKGQLGEGMDEFNRALEINPGLSDVHLRKGLINISRGNILEAETDLRAASQSAPDVVNPKLVLASYYIKKNDYAKALSVLNSGIKGSPDDAVFYNYMARVYMLQDQKDEAIKVLVKAKTANPAVPESTYNLVSVYMARKDYDRGIQELTGLLSRTPNDLKALLQLAGIYEARSMDAEAKKYYEQAKATKKPEAYVGYAQFYARKKEYDRAIGVLNEAIALKTPDTSALLLKAGIMATRKDYGEALKCLEQLGKIDPKQALPLIVNTYLAMKKTDEALKRVTQELRSRPGDVALMAEVSRIQMIKGNKQEAVNSAKDIINARPDSPEGYLTLAMVYKDSREIDNAIDTLKRGMTTGSSNVAMMLAGSYIAKKDYASALETYRKLEKSAPGNVAAIFQQGVVLSEMGKNKTAVAEYTRVLKLSPNYLPALNNLAYIYAAENRELVKAVEYASRAYAVAPNDGSVLDTMGLVLLKTKKTEEAYRMLTRAAEALPDNPTVLYHLAMACHERGDRTQATGHLQKALQAGSFPEEGSARLLLDKIKRG